MSDNNNTPTPENATNWLASLLRALGLPATWASIIAGAIIGAIAAAWALTGTSCTPAQIDATANLIHTLTPADLNQDK